MGRYLELETFIRVVEDGSLSAAARSLSMTPSAVSKIVSRLEARLNTRLLNRTSRVLTVTTDGASFYEAGLRAIEAMEDADTAVSSEPRGTLKIQSLPSFGMYQLAPLVPALLRRYPELKLEFLLTMGALDTARGVDVLIQVGSVADSSLVMRRIAATRYVFCAAPSYLARSGPVNSVEELQHHNCLNFSVPTVFQTWTRLLEDGRVEHIPGAGNTTANQGEMLLELARAGVGIVCLADFHAHRDLVSGALVQLLADLPTPQDPIFAVYQDRRYLSPRIRVFLDFLVERFSRASPWHIVTETDDTERSRKTV